MRDHRSVLLRLVTEERAGVQHVVIDSKKTSAGRGAWIHLRVSCLELALRRRAVPRALRVIEPLDLAEVTQYFAEQLDAPVSAGASSQVTRKRVEQADGHPMSPQR